MTNPTNNGVPVASREYQRTVKNLCATPEIGPAGRAVTDRVTDK
ncbi:hypothetical protein GCM10009678_41870 [Actinomadura kijaniata]